MPRSPVGRARHLLGYLAGAFRCVSPLFCVPVLVIPFACATRLAAMLEALICRNLSSCEFRLLFSFPSGIHTDDPSGIHTCRSMRTTLLLSLFLIALLVPWLTLVAAPASGGPAQLATLRCSTLRARCTACVRDSRGRIARSSTARHEFQRLHPCPSTGRSTGACPGYVIDHLTPLKRGGADAPSNMQWQTKAAAKAKDRIE